VIPDVPAGPWLISGSGDGPFDVQDANGNHVATLVKVRGGLAVARAIASAPCLLEAVGEGLAFNVSGFTREADRADAWAKVKRRMRRAVRVSIHGGNR